MQKKGAGLRVGINGLFWPQERTGSGQYTRHLWTSLQKDGANEYILLADEISGSLYKGIGKSELKLQAVPPLVRLAGENAVKLWWEQFGLNHLVRKSAREGSGFDVVHYPYFAAPLFKPPGRTGLIVTIHDLIPLALPEYTPSLPLKFYFQLVKAAARQADLIMADSEFSKRDILKYLKVPPRKVQVVYLAADERFQPGYISFEQRQDLFRRYGLEGNERVIFYLGGFDRRKNVITLLKAFGQALPELKKIEQADKGGKWVLALAGKPHSDNSFMFPDLAGPTRRIFSTGEDAARVRFLGPVSEIDKPFFYRTADIYAFPSTYEGFGLDPLEALASGTPVIASDATCLPEITGEAALKVPPENTAKWCEAILELASSPERRATLSKAGPIQAEKFSWEKTANRTLELYNVVECVRTRGVAGEPQTL